MSQPDDFQWCGNARFEKNASTDTREALAAHLPDTQPAQPTCTRSHPHEDMRPTCEALTVKARDEFAARTAQPSAQGEAVFKRLVNLATHMGDTAEDFNQGNGPESNYRAARKQFEDELRDALASAPAAPAQAVPPKVAQTLIAALRDGNFNATNIEPAELNAAADWVLASASAPAAPAQAVPSALPVAWYEYATAQPVAVPADVFERCAQIVEAEHVGQSLDDDTLHQGDMAYNAALKHAAAAIREEADSPQPEPSDLYLRLHSLSKSLEGSGRIDEHVNPDAYATVLDAMNFVRAHGIAPKAAQEKTDE